MFSVKVIYSAHSSGERTFDTVKMRSGIKTFLSMGLSEPIFYQEEKLSQEKIGATVVSA